MQLYDILNAHITKGFEKTYRTINLKGVGGWGIASLLHSVPLHHDLGWGGDRFIASLRSASSRFGVGRGSLHCFTPFRFIVIWGWGGDRFIASLRSASS